MKPTLPSRKVNHRVFLENDGECILEVKRSQTFFIYEINNQGEETLLTSSNFPYIPQNGEKEEDYFLDYLNPAVLQKISVLTTVFDYQEVVNGLISIMRTVEENYSFRDFDMECAYFIEDFKEVLQQLISFTQDCSYTARLDKSQEFYDAYFYNRQTELSTDEKQIIVNQLKQDILFLQSLSSN